VSQGVILHSQPTPNSLTTMPQDHAHNPCSLPQAACNATTSLIRIYAVCCSMLQCIAVCCRVSHCTHQYAARPHSQPLFVTTSRIHIFAVCCSVVQCGAVWCSVVQCVAVCHVALTTTPQDHTHSPRTLPLAPLFMSIIPCSMLQCVAVCCSVLQCVAVCCSVLQCVAVCCSVSFNIS